MQIVQLLAATALAFPAEARQRVTFESSGTQIVGYHYPPVAPKGPAPAVIIAHGLGGLQSSRLQPYAERFAAAGYNALTFDYRYWGESAGEPRNIIEVVSQEDDYQAAIAYMQTLSSVDPKRIVVWGTSLSGGHALQLGAKLSNLSAVIVQAPHVNGPATVSQLPPASLPGLIAVGVDDDARAAANAPPLYIPTANKTGEYGALTQAGAYEGYQFVQPNPPPPGNVFPARFVTELPFFSPDVIAPKSKVPTFFAVGLTDNIVSPEASLALAKKMNATLLKLPGAGHFDVYPGKFAYEQNVRAQLAFLQKNVPL